MRNFVCPNCNEKIHQNYFPTKNWFVFGTQNGCGVHEIIQEFNIFTFRQDVVYTFRQDIFNYLFMFTL